MIGLALSGGGFRATLFHLGALWHLNEVSLRPEIDRFSSVSGGSIFAGLLASRWDRLKFRGGIASNFREEISMPIWRFCSMNIDVCAVVGGLIPGVRVLERHYERYLVGRLTLHDLPDCPEFVFNAAHLETGRNWTFSRSVMRTYRIGEIQHPRIPIAKVIAASSAFPPAFAPVVLRLRPADFVESQFADLYHRDDLKRKVTLTDGGVYDNLGVHAIRDFETILISDASNPLGDTGSWHPLKGFTHRSKRPMEIAIEQTRALRRHNIVSSLVNGEKSGAFWAVGTNLQRYPSPCPFDVNQRWALWFENVRTRLNSFGDNEKARLINWGYIQCDLAIRSYFLKDRDPPEQLPYSNYGFSQAP